MPGRRDLAAVAARERRADELARASLAATPPTRRIDGLVAGDVDDRRLDADAARAAVEHDVDVVAEVGAHVRGGRRAHAPEAVRRRRRDAAAERVEQRERERMVGHADTDGVAAARRLVARRAPALRGTTSVSGPGQNASASARATSGTSRAESSSCPRARDVHDHRDDRPGRPFTA